MTCTEQRTDHNAHIADLRERAEATTETLTQLVLYTAADLLEIHDATGLSLDNWGSARALVEYLIDEPITRNGA